MISVFSKQWFKKYSKAITWLARLPFVGEFIFNFKKYGHYIDRKKIVEVTPNSVIEFVKRKGKKVELKQHFFVRNEYALRLQSVFYPIWITFHIWDIITRPIPQLNLGFDTLTVYPDAGTGATTVDGRLGKFDVTGTWSDVRDGAGSLAQATATDDDFAQIRDNGTSWMAIARFIATLDTSSLPDTATISSVVFSLYGTGVENNHSGQSLNIYGSTPAANNNLSTSDYGNCGTTAYATAIANGSLSASGYNNFTFNSTGISNVSKTGITKLSCRYVSDASNTEPTMATNRSKFAGYHSDYSSNKPKLVVTYTVVVGPANVKTYKGLAAASVKTCKGLAIASVKTKKGLV